MAWIWESAVAISGKPSATPSRPVAASVEVDVQCDDVEVVEITEADLISFSLGFWLNLVTMSATFGEGVALMLGSACVVASMDVLCMGTGGTIIFGGS